MMRKLSIIFLTLALLLPALGVQAESLVPFVCEEQGYTTLVSPAWETEWVDGDGVYFRLDSELTLPYVLAWVNAESSRIADGAAFLSEELPLLQEQYSANGSVSYSQYGSFSVAGRPVAAADMQYYNSDGAKIYLLIVVDVREDFTAIFRSRYFDESQRQGVLDALDMIDSNLALSGGAAQDSSTERSADTSASAMAFTITDIAESSSVFGRCAAPQGYTVDYDHYICTHDQSASYPCMVVITAMREDGPELYYWSARDFFSGTGDDAAAQDGQFNNDFQTPMLHYMSASDYSDYLVLQYVNQLNADEIIVEEENTFPQLRNTLDTLAKERRQALTPEDPLTGSLLSVDDVRATLSCKSYSFSMDGTRHRAAVYTGVLAEYYTLNGYATVQWINWAVPFTYILFCPEEDWAEGRAAFELFVSNTAASDQFTSANREMSDAIWAGIRKAHDVTDCVDIAAGALYRATSEADDYDEDRFTDYIFDQNDYTLSDGSHVKISTAYDYVYEGDNGVVYYSGSAFTQPGGSTQLYPNG